MGDRVIAVEVDRGGAQDRGRGHVTGDGDLLEGPSAEGVPLLPRPRGGERPGSHEGLQLLGQDVGIGRPGPEEGVEVDAHAVQERAVAVLPDGRGPAAVGGPSGAALVAGVVAGDQRQAQVLERGQVGLAPHRVPVPLRQVIEVNDAAESAQALDERDVLRQRRLAAGLVLGLDVDHDPHVGADIVVAELGLGFRVLAGQEVVGEVEGSGLLRLRHLRRVLGVEVVGALAALDADSVDTAQVNGALAGGDVGVEKSLG